MSEKFINISFPFEEDYKGKFLKMERTSQKAIKADLLHLLLTNRKQRLYLPSFGIDLKKYLFEQNEGTVHEAIRREIELAIQEFIPDLTILAITVNKSERNEHAALVKLDYKATTASFSGTDFIEIEI